MELSQRLDLGGLELEEDTPADTFSRLAEIVEEVAGVVVKQSSRFDDTAIASLDRIEMAVRIEEAFGVRIDDTVLTEHPTAGELADYLEEKQ